MNNMIENKAIIDYLDYMISYLISIRGEIYQSNLEINEGDKLFSKSSEGVNEMLDELEKISPGIRSKIMKRIEDDKTNHKSIIREYQLESIIN